MPDPSDLTLGVLFRAREDPNFKRITRRLATIVTGFQQGMDKVDRAAKKAAQSIKEIDAASRRAEKGLSGAARGGDQFNKQIGHINRGLDRLIRSFQVVAAYWISGTLFRGLTQGLRVGAENIINFDQALYNLKAITGATSGEIAAMRDVIGETAIRTKFSSTEIAEGMVLLGQAGLSAGESLKAVQAVADLAAGTLSDFKNVTDLVTTALRAFNIDAGETRRVADIMANAVNKSKLTIDKLRTAFNYVGAGAAQAGLSLEQTAQTMALLANNGMRASTIGTGLRQVLSRLLAPNAKLRTAMAEYGLQLDRASGEADWFEKQIAKLTSVMFDFERNTVDMSKAYQLFGLRGAQAAAILVSSYMKLDGTWERMLANMNEIGAAQRMMEEQSKGLGFKVKNLTDQLKELAIVAGEAGGAGAFGKMIDALRDATTRMVYFGKTGIGQVIFNAGLLITTLYSLKAVLLAVGYALKTISGSLGAFFLNPITLAIGAVALLGAGIVTLMTRQNRLNKELEKSVAINRGYTASLQNYKLQLQAVDEGSKEYAAVIGRLIQAHPELKDKIDKSNQSLEEMLEIIENIEKTKLDDIWKATAQRLANMSDNLAMTIKRWKEIGEAQGAYGKNFLNFMKATKGGSEDAEAIQQAIEGWANDLFKVRENSEEVEKMYARIRGTLKNIKTLEKGSVNLQVAKGVAKVDDELLDISDHTKEWISGSEVIEFIMKMVLDKYKEISNMADNVSKRHEDLARKRVDPMNQLGYRDFYEKLNDLDKFTFAEAWDRTVEAWAKRLRFMEVNERQKYKTQEEWEKHTLEMKQKFFDKELEDWDKNGERRLKSYKKLMDKIMEFRVKTFGAGLDEGFYDLKKKYEGLKKTIDDMTLDQKQKKEFLADLWAGFYKEMQALVDEGKLPGTLFQQKEIEAFQSKLAKAGGITMPGAGKIPSRSKTPAEEERPDQKEWIKQQEALEKELAKWRKEEAKYEAELTEEKYRRGEVSAQQYFDKLRVLVNEGGMEWRDYLEIVDRETRDVWGNLREGWKKYFGEMETSAEFFERFGTELPEQIANNFADAFGDFVTGVKNAKEAFQDFARDMLRWIAEIFAKRAMMQAMSWIGFHSGGMYGESKGAPRKLKRPTFAVKLHDGLMPDEFPAILKKDEGVFTKKQMQALGMMINGGGTQISVPVNINGGANGDMLKRYLPNEIEDVILKTMRKYS